MARFRIIPRDERFFVLFEQAADHAVRGAETLQQMLADMEHAEDYRRMMSDIEHAGDSVIHDVMGKLNRTFVTPIDPEDIRAIANSLDDIIDYTHAAAERIVLYHATSAHEKAGDLAAVLVQATKEVKAVVSLLHDLSRRKEIMELCIEINRLENAGDRVYREALGNLFRDGDMMELIRWKEIFEQIEQAVDQCEDLADTIELTLTKHS